jgi:hypothetical protein
MDEFDEIVSDRFKCPNQDIGWRLKLVNAKQSKSNIKNENKK